MTRSSRVLILILALSLFPVLHAAYAASSRHAVQDFFRYLDVAFVRISPSGRYVAIMSRGADGKQLLAARDTTDLKKVEVAADFATTRVQDGLLKNERVQRVITVLSAKKDQLLSAGTTLSPIQAQ